MKHYILKFLLLLLVVGTPYRAFACWDDDADDYYMYDDDDWDDDDDWWDDDSYELDEVTVIGSASSSDDDDWWRVDYSYDDDDSGDEGWDIYDDEENDYSSSSDDGTITITGDDGNIMTPHTLSEKDHLSVDIETLKKIHMKQGTAFSCVSAGMEYVALVFGITDLKEGDIMLSLYRDGNKSFLSGSYNSETISDNLCDIATKAGLHVDNSVTDYKSAIDAGEVIITTIEQSEGNNHNIVIVGYDDEHYIAYDTISGSYVTVSEEYIGNAYNIGVKK